MSTPLEQQTEEREALQSIYEGDTNFKEIDSVTFQYKVSHMDKKKHTNMIICNIINEILVWRRG